MKVGQVKMFDSTGFIEHFLNATIKQILEAIAFSTPIMLDKNTKVYSHWPKRSLKIDLLNDLKCIQKPSKNVIRFSKIENKTEKIAKLANKQKTSNLEVDPLNNTEA